MKTSTLNKALLFSDDDNIIIECHYYVRSAQTTIVKGQFHNLVFKDLMLALQVFKLLEIKYPNAIFSSQFKQLEMNIGA